MTTAKKKTSPALAAQEPKPEVTPKTPRAKKVHVLYQGDSTGIGDVRYYGDRTKAWEALATDHTGADGWKYITTEVGASLADAIQAGA